MFLAFWIGWALIGLAFAVWLFWWAIRTRQFEQSRRAALIPFDDIEPEDFTEGDSGRHPASSLNLFVIIFLVVAGVAVTSVMLFLAIIAV